VAETLERLGPLRRRGLKLAVATTKKTDTALRVVRELGLERFFDAVLGTDGIPHKPAPDLLLLCARTVGATAQGGLMIGDTVHDLQAGRAAGMRTCGAAWGTTGAAGLAAQAPDWMIHVFSEIYEIVTDSPSVHWPRSSSAT
jgi:phosphoglycolate phosphatase